MTPVDNTDAARLRRDIEADPLAWFAADLDRVRPWTDLVDHLASEACDPRNFEAVVNVLRVDLPRLFAITELAVMPMLLSRIRPGDDIDAVAGLLSDNYYTLPRRLREYLPRLEAYRLAAVPVERESWLGMSLCEFEAHLKQHLALISAVILPIARLRLKPSDLDIIAIEVVKRVAAQP